MEISVKTAEASMDELATLLPEYPTVIVGKLATKSPRMKSLLAKSSVKIVELKKGVFSYKATDPLLIKGVRIYCTELDQAAKFINIRAINMGGSLGARKRGYRPKGMEYLYVPLDSYGIGFEVEVNVAKAVIPVTKIEVTGYSLQQLDEFAETLQKGIDIRIGLDKFITEYRAEFVDLTDELAIAKEDLDKVSNQSAKISSEVNLVIEELAGIELKRSGIVAEMEKLAEANRASENAKSSWKVS